MQKVVLTPRLIILSSWALFTVLFFVQVGRPLLADEADFFRVALPWSQGVRPAEDLWHTPIYMEALAGWLGLWGSESRWVARSFGYVSALLTFAVFLGSLRWLRRRGQIRAASDYTSADALIFASVCLHPYFIQSSLLLDIDNTLMIPALLLGSAVLIQWTRTPTHQLSLALGLILAISLMIKEITPVFLMMAWVGCSPFLSRKHFYGSVLGSAVCLVLFVAFLWGWGLWRGFHWHAPLDIMIARTQASEAGGIPWKTLGWARFLFLTYLPFLFIGLPVWILILKRKLGWARDTMIPIVFCIFSFAVYLKLVQMSYYFPKYTAFIWPVMAFVLAISGVVKGRDFAKKWTLQRKAIFIGFCALLLILGLVPALDPLMIIELRREWSLEVLILHGVAVLVPAVLIFGPFGFSKVSRLALLCVFLFAHSAGQASRERSSLYRYGESGFTEMLNEVQALRSRLGDKSVVVTTERDLYLAAPTMLELISLDDPNSAKFLKSADAILYRTYGSQSPHHSPKWLDSISKEFSNLEQVQAPGQRFEWRWR